MKRNGQGCFDGCIFFCVGQTKDAIDFCGLGRMSVACRFTMVTRLADGEGECRFRD